MFLQFDCQDSGWNKDFLLAGACKHLWQFFSCFADNLLLKICKYKGYKNNLFSI